MELDVKQTKIAKILYEEGDMESYNEAERAAEAYINWHKKIEDILNL